LPWVVSSLRCKRPRNMAHSLGMFASAARAVGT
jgi:hypothetical protein